VATQPTTPVEVFFSYSHRDEDLKNELLKHLANLERQGIITGWHDRKIIAGQEWAGEIDEHLDSARVILLLISPDFMFSKYCNDIEVRRAMERHEAGEARVIPVILRAVDWEGAPFSKLQGVPTDVKPVTLWKDRDEAFLTVVKEIRRALKELSTAQAKASPLHIIPRSPIVGFVARRDRDGNDIVERLRDELAPHKHQVVALWGAGGVGKTTLASEAVRSMAEAFAQRVVWISADQRSNLPFVTFLDEIAAQLGDEDLRRLALEQKIEAVRALINVAPTLIVLDNFETITPEDQLQCMEFLAERARCTALITTRQKIERAVAIPIAAMSMEEANDFLQRLINQTQDPDIYAELDRNRLIQTAEANPLIIEWIVGQIDLANDPEEVLDDLSHGEGDAAHRVFDRSFNLRQMADGGRAVLLALSLFTPSATRSALAEVSGMGKDKDKKRFKKAQETLASLWLIKKTEAGQRLSVAGLTRELTKAHLAVDPRDKTFRQRFTARFLKHAEANRNPTAEHFHALEEEKDNILNAMDVASDVNDWLSVMRMSDSVSELLMTHGYWDEAIRRGEQALTAAHKLQDKVAIARFTHNTAIIFHNRGELKEAQRLYNESLEIKKRIGQQSGIAATLYQMAMLTQDQGELDEARRLYNESLEMNKRLDNQSGISTTLQALGTLAQDQGELDGARQLYNESLRIKKRLGDHRGIAATLRALGTLAQDQGELDEARRLYNESLESSERLGEQSGIAASLHQLGTVYLDERNIEGAENLLNQSLTILRKLSHKQFIAECLESIGKLRSAQGSFAEAHELFNESLDIASSLRDKFRAASVKRSMGLLAEKENETPKAVELLREALSVFESLKSPKAEDTRRDLERLEG